MEAQDTNERTHRVSVVIPVYRGEMTLPKLLGELSALREPVRTPDGHQIVVAEVLLVHDHGPDDSARVIREIAAEHDFVRPIWLSRNFGQHAATLAGMASSGSEWIVTMDEDGQHDPTDIGAMIDVALRERAALVYAAPTNRPSHGWWRNTASRGSKRVVMAMIGSDAPTRYHSYRLILGEIGRSVAAYAGPGVYLDVAIGWVTDRVATCPIEVRDEGQRVSGYTLRTLLSHFWRMVLTSGTRGLRLVSVIGSVFALAGLVLAVVLLVAKIEGSQLPQGWTSLIIVVLISTGAVLFSLGVIAEYLGVAVNMAMGKPLYLIVGDEESGPLAEARRTR
ncbi:MAG: glycosyltransferase [Jatrophihabitans sp.]|uniref:glycosyltransferase n=1 Tax=Jatrophihabitans sp. TaxID=1932789 RepID=UPI003F7FBC6D